MNRHDLLYIHPAKAPCQETTAFALTGTDSAVPDQNQASKHRSRRLIQAVCRRVGAHASRSIGDLAIPPNGVDPKFP